MFTKCGLQIMPSLPMNRLMLSDFSPFLVIIAVDVFPHSGFLFRKVTLLPFPFNIYTLKNI